MQLQHLDEFKDILDTYVISDHGKQVLNSVRLVPITAPTSTGKNTVMRELASTGRYLYVVSDTTRPPRKNDGILEQNGREYWFRNEEELLDDLKAGELLEAEVIHNQQVSGISIRELEKAATAGKVAISDVDPQGISNIVKAKPDTLVIMLLPPSFEEWQKRLAARGQMRPDEERRRYETALKVFDDALEQDYYHFVITEDIEQSVALIDAIVAGETNPHQGRAPGLIQHLQESLHQKLQSTKTSS
jgi:guanylate kinase